MAVAVAIRYLSFLPKPPLHQTGIGAWLDNVNNIRLQCVKGAQHTQHNAWNVASERHIDEFNALFSPPPPGVGRGVPWRDEDGDRLPLAAEIAREWQCASPNGCLLSQAKGGHKGNARHVRQFSVSLW